MTEQNETPVEEKEGVESQIQKLMILGNECAVKGDINGVLKVAAEIAEAKKSLDVAIKAQAQKLREENQSLIMDLLSKCGAEFDKAIVKCAPLFERLAEVGHVVEVAKFQVDYTAEEPIKAMQFGPKKVAVASKGTGGNGKKSSKVVVLEDGTSMGTREFVEAYANDEERASKTFESWPTALAEKIAKRIGATIQAKESEETLATDAN